MARGWDQMTFEVPSNPRHPVILLGESAYVHAAEMVLPESTSFPCTNWAVWHGTSLLQTPQTALSRAILPNVGSQAIPSQHEAVSPLAF